MTSENNRLAKNTLVLYIRLGLVMLISLYISRILLRELGVEDYGIYNVVGGVIMMFGFLNSSMISATNRFYAHAIGINDIKQLNRVFSTCVNFHILIAILLLLLSETIGLWFLRTQMRFPLERLIAVEWIFQFSLVSFLLSVVSIPISALVIATENMKTYASVGIIEIILRLGAALLLHYFKGDKLTYYGALITIISFIVLGIYISVYFKRYRQIHYHLFWDKILVKSIFSHSGWMLTGTISNMLSTQGINILINIFFGVTINASRAIAYQIQSAVNSFISNFMTAVQPQIIKTYAQGDDKRMYDLIFLSSKFSFYLLFIIALPALILMEEILQLWLKNVPDLAVLFSQLTVIDLFFTVLFRPISTYTQATGRIRFYQLIVSSCFLLTFLVTLIAYKIGMPSYVAFVIVILVSLIGLFLRLVILKRYYNFAIREYTKKVLLRITIVAILAPIFPLLINQFNIIEPLHSITIIATCTISTLLFVWVCGMNNEEKLSIKQYIKIK